MGLGISWSSLLFQGVSFIILFVLLSFVAFKPLMKILDERAKRVKDGLEQVEAIKEQSSHAGEEVKKQIEVASQRGTEIIAQATRSGEEIRTKAQELARQDVEAMVERARGAIEAERDEAIGELRKELADITVMATGRIIGESLDKKSHKKIIDKILEETQTLKKG